jgi:hypothetical protein
MRLHPRVQQSLIYSDDGAEGLKQTSQKLNRVAGNGQVHVRETATEMSDLEISNGSLTGPRGSFLLARFLTA